ncbi:MAG TPA: S9 family peptidase [Dehalococcoidia bacterium]|nr:S9 family peptidase [Dehalococcoidia bacterium]
MPVAEVAPYGSWKSPITADLIVASSISLGSIAVDGEDVYWLEGRPLEGGRQVLVRRTPDGAVSDVTPAPYNVRTRVHEYGGGSYAVHQGVVYFSNFADQRLYRLRPATSPEPLTSAEGMRYADGVVDPARGLLYCVREDHTRSDQDAENTIVAIDLETGAETVVARGHDFYSTPRLSPDGSRLSWLSWDHPNMPWDGTELWLARLGEDGLPQSPERVAGGPSESIFQPEWSPDGRLYFVSDATGWWNLHRLGDRGAEIVVEREAEFGAPQWVFDARTYAFLPDGRLLCAYAEGGVSRLALLDPEARSLQPIDIALNGFGSVRVAGDRAYFVASSPSLPGAVYELDLRTQALTPLRWSSDLRIDDGYISLPEPLEFPTEGGLTAHALYYAPRNKDYRAPEGEKPPLIVMSHGGPTAAAGAGFSLQKQFWTSRGFAVLDVNYGGSTGYGCEYRRRLEGKWGVVDVDDCTNGARYLASRGLVDPGRMAITGGSAGGYTTLCALAFRDVFKAGASHFGVADLEALARDTHKFESRYLDRLVGPYPERRDLYVERSPVHHVDRLACPVIFFQGLEDKIVPPNQAEAMVEALRRKGIPVAYLAFEGEQHGFRRAENIKRSMEAELYFYGRIFGFRPADEIEPVEIMNL